MCHILQTSRMVTLECQKEMVEESKKSNDTSAATAMEEAYREALEKPKPPHSNDM
jgi:hypothetical protein